MDDDGMIINLLTYHLLKWYLSALIVSSLLSVKISVQLNFQHQCQNDFTEFQFPFAGKIIRYIGTANAIFFNIVIESTRLLIYSWVEQSPPYYALGLHALDFTLWSFSWVGTLTYGYLITPPTIAATMSTVLALTEFTISKSLGTFIGGQLRSLLTRQELFRWTAFVTTGLGLVYYLLYYLLARKSEKLIIEQLNLKYPQRLKKIKDDNKVFPEEDIIISKFWF